MLPPDTIQVRVYLIEHGEKRLHTVQYDMSNAPGALVALAALLDDLKTTPSVIAIVAMRVLPDQTWHTLPQPYGLHVNPPATPNT